MDYLELVGAKSRPGSIHYWVNYKKTPVEVVLDEAQTLIYSRLRVREMRVSTVLTLPAQAFSIALPTRFLEPIMMRDRDGWEVIPDHHVSEAGLFARRSYDSDVVTTLDGAVTAGASSIVVASASEFPTTGNYSILVDSEVMLVTGGQGTTTWTVTRGFGGTTAAAHSTGATVDGTLDEGVPTHVAISDERFQFECRADAERRYDLAFYQSPALLSASNQTNWLTTRYPHLVRKACQASAADFMKDTAEYARLAAELYALIDSANAEADMSRAA